MKVTLCDRCKEQIDTLSGRQLFVVTLHCATSNQPDDVWELCERCAGQVKGQVKWEANNQPPRPA